MFGKKVVKILPHPICTSLTKEKRNFPSKCVRCIDLAKKFVLGCVNSPPRPEADNATWDKLFWPTLYKQSVVINTRFLLLLNPDNVLARREAIT